MPKFETIKIRAALIFLMICGAANFWLNAPRAVLNVGGKNHVYFANATTDIRLRYVHSVQKTPVEEFYGVNTTNDGFVLKSTRYQSFGVGLPFSPEDGKFRREGDYFVMDGMDREFKSLSFRPGVGTELTIWINGDEYKIYELVPVGSLVNLSISSQYKLTFGY